MRKSCIKCSLSADDIVSVFCDVKTLSKDGYTFSLDLIYSLYLSTSHGMILLPNDTTCFISILNQLNGFVLNKDLVKSNLMLLQCPIEI